MEAKLQVADSVGSNSDANSIRTIDDRVEECSRSPPNECAGTSFSASEVWAASKRSRVRPRKHSGCQSAASPSPAVGTHEYPYILSAHSTSMRPRRECPPLTVTRTSQTALAVKRIKRLAARQNHFSAQKTCFRATRSLKAEEPEPEPADQTLHLLELTNVVYASSKSSGLETSISMEEPPSVSLVHSLHLPGVYHLSSPQVR